MLTMSNMTSGMRLEIDRGFTPTYKRSHRFAVTYGAHNGGDGRGFAPTFNRIHRFAVSHGTRNPNGVSAFTRGCEPTARTMGDGGQWIMER